MEANREVLASFERLVVLTVWRAILELITFLVVMVIVYHVLA